MTITIFNFIVSIMEDEEDVCDRAIVKTKNEKKKKKKSYWTYVDVRASNRN